MSRHFLLFTLCLALTACASRTDNVATSVAATLTARPTGLPAPTLEPPTALPLPTATPELPTSAPPTPITPGAVLGQHIVQSGETLFCIGRAYGVHPEAIALANQLDPNTTVALGQVLQIPAEQWTDIPPGAACPPQFVSPFPGVSAPASTGVQLNAPTLVPAGTLVPAATLGPDPRGPESLLLLEPGPGSTLSSTVHVAGQADPTFEQNLVILITDAEGKFLSTVATTIAAESGQRGTFAADVPVTVLTTQPGRITVYALSPRDGGLTHLASVEMTLAPNGSASIAPAQRHPESIALFEPTLLASVSGGVVRLSGYADYVFENQLNVVICGAGGSGAPEAFCGTPDNVLGSGTVFVSSPDFNLPGAFSGEVAYSVTQETRGRIVVYSTSPRDGKVTHLTSVEVVLKP